MATIMKFDLENKTNIPILYVDSINKSSYIEEMINYIIRYIREITNKSIDNRNDYIVSSIDDIHKKCDDGYWIIIDEKEVVLYKKELSKGNFYNSVYVNEIFKLKSYECPRIVPKLLKKPSMFDSFTDELKASVSNYRTRARSTV